MISNNTTYKLKSSQSTSEFYDYDQNNFDNCESNIIDKSGNDSNNRSQFYLRDGKIRNSSRGRVTEFRASNWSFDRKSLRSRPTSSRGRGERDGFDSFKKYHDSTTRNSDIGSQYYGKFYEPERKNEIKLNLPEDTRISKLLRRLSIETDQDNSLAISKKLLEVLLFPDNAPYIRKAYHILSESMYEILQVSPGSLAKKQAAKALGRMGYIMGQENDFERHQNWIFNKMTTAYDDLQILLMETFQETLSLEKEMPVLQENIDHLLRNLISIIETIESPPIFKVILDTIMNIVEIYPENFFPFFRDTVDLLFGWHVDHTQPLSLIEYVSNNLQRIPKHFQYNLEFSVTLMENFVEDIINYSKQLINSGESSFLEHITVLILAMNTVLKSLGNSLHPIENKKIKPEFVNSLVGQIINTTSDALESYIPENLMIATNDCISMLLMLLETKSQILVNKVYNLIDLEMSLVNEFSDSSIVSMLIFISKVLKELSANLPVSLIERLVGPNSELLKLRYSPFDNIQKSVICVYQALLNLKNVYLVQEAYRYILSDFEIVYKKLSPNFKQFISNNPFQEIVYEGCTKNEENVAIFMLRCLSQLANASSIIVMWALKPSILELVAVHLIPYDLYLAQNAPNLQFSLIYLLYSHCKCYNHYISTSNLMVEEEKSISRFTITDDLRDDIPHLSPNSGNFEIILDIIHKTLITDIGYELIILLLTWIKDILDKSEIYLTNMYNKKSFVAITEVLVKCGYNLNEEISLKVYENLEKLLKNKHLPWNNSFLLNVTDLCKIHMSSNKENLRKAYTTLSSLIPWDVAVVEFNKTNQINYLKHQNSTWKDYNSYIITMGQYLHSTGAIDSELSPSLFKRLMNFMLNENTLDNNFLEEIFISSLCLDGDSQMNMELFCDLGIYSKSVLYNWVTLEAAQYCVNSKLRTPLGKPNETFTKIEGSLNHLGNELLLINKDNLTCHNKEVTKIRVKLLLQFIEHLEKRIYNASEGCAVAMPQPNKLVRTFFIANSNTCNEWITRIRMVIIHIAMHASEFSIAVRNGYALLKEMLSLDKSQTADFERCTIFITLALINQRETEAIYGLYVWCKNILKKGHRYSWIKHASEQSDKKYELAIEGYKKVLKQIKERAETEDENTSKINVEIQNFINDQIEVCLKEFYNWTDLIAWNENSNSEELRKNCYYVNDWDCINNLAKLDECLYEVNELSEWSNDEPKSWSSYTTLSNIENNLYQIALQLFSNSANENLSDKIQININLIENSIQNHLGATPCEISHQFSLLRYIGNGLKNVSNGIPAHSVFLVSDTFENGKDMIDSSILRKVLWWSEFFNKTQNQGFNSFICNLRLDIIKRARKEKNYNLAFKHIYNFLIDKQLLVNNQDLEKSNLANLMIAKMNDVNVWTTDVAQSMTEVIKILYEKEDNKNDVFNLCASTSTAISKYSEMYGGIELRKISSKILLKLASWLQGNNSSLTEMSSPLGKLLLVLPDLPSIDNNLLDIMPLSDMAIGKLLQFSIHQCITLAKGWNYFGTWCYKWGRKIIDQGAKVKNNLSEDDCIAIKNSLPLDTTDEEFNEILQILSQNRNITDEEHLDSNIIKTSAMIKEQLQNIRPLKNASHTVSDNLLLIWKNTQKKIYNYYNLAAESYFKYLHLVANSENTTKSTECSTITITLRLLRLIVRYALELQGTLEEGIKASPTQPWKVIIPQLFSRLNHPESYVHHCISDLLCRVAEDSPHLITFPAVVGALEGGVKFNFSEIKLPKDCLSQENDNSVDSELNENDEDENDNYECDVEEVTSSLQSSFKVLVDTLSKQDPETISQVQLLVKELRRITLLWDELWLGTLLQHSSEINKRQIQLEHEIEKVVENFNIADEEKISLIAEKHRIIIKPIIFILEQLREVTSVEAETPHEKLFQEMFSTEIDRVIMELKQPKSPEKATESFVSLKNLQKKFQTKIHKRTAYSLKMHDISPILANIRDTMVAMPGLTSSKSTVKISHVSSVVSILPTKTKPKKIVFYGSDGQTYTYLFKGLEDLHLDERIMQFLNIVNVMMAKNTDRTSQNLYRARHYSVIPLGPRSGLINWVEGTTPVFSLYKRWQQRESAKPVGKNSSNPNSTVLRPSELFYNKLNPLLIANGVKNIENRKEWPLGLLKQVLTELMAETPSDLLAKELWCNAISANDWWNVTKRYSYSVAVMSIIGYIIGLGDRHLDNVLVDLTTGEVVHIDYNVCFEKGKTLRVPEKVPFRLTPNIRDALGVTGVEGIFRLACENVLKSMRKGRETLLTLLEAFVYDPLIDWTVGGEVLAASAFGNIPSMNNIKQSRKEMEKELTISMFNVRCTEMKVEWTENMEDILKKVVSLSEKLQKWLIVEKSITENEDGLQDLHQQMALIKEAEAQGSKIHPLHSLPNRYDAYNKTKDTLKNAKKNMEVLILEIENHIKSYNQSLMTIDGPEVIDWLLELKAAFREKNENAFDLVKEFLHNAGKDEIVNQCEKVGNEVDELITLHNKSIQKCLQLLQEYRTLKNQCPKSYENEHRMFLYLEWLNYLLNKESSSACDEIYEKFHNFHDSTSAAKHILNFMVNLDSYYKETSSKMNKLYEDLSVYSTDIQTLDKLYINARNGISTFLKYEKNADKAFEFIVTSDLLILNRSFLTLETAAHKSGEWLIKLTSREGDWFLDDLVLNSSRAVELISNLPLPSSEEHLLFYQIFNCVRLSNNIYKGLDELYFNFHTIILPECMKKIQSEDESLIQVIANLKNILSSAGISISDMIVQMVKILPCLLMQMEITPSYAHVLERFTVLKTEFIALINADNNAMTPGKMLLIGFNGLFEKLTMEWNNLINALSLINLPNSWKKLDQVKDAKIISPHVCNSKVLSLLEDIFLLKRLQAISDFFNLTLETCQSFKGTSSITYSDEQLAKPIRQFIADFISRQLLGITTENIAYIICYLLQDLGFDVVEEIEQNDIGAESKVPLEDLYHKAGNVFLKQGLFSQSSLSQASTLGSNVKHAWIKIQETKKIQQKISLLQSSQLRLHNQITIQNFMYEEILAPFNLYTSVRSKFIMDLKTEFHNLQLTNEKLREVEEKQEVLIENSYQRLNWAKGVNPEVAQISSAFQNSVRTKNNQLRILKNISERIMQISDAILTHEHLRNNTIESKTFDKNFIGNIEKWKIACQYCNTKCDILTPMEENIMNLLTKELIEDPKWLEKLSEKITHLITIKQNELSEKKADLFAVCDTVTSDLDGLNNNFNSHYRLMSDVKNLIKSMTKIDDYSEISQKFIVNYRAYIDNFNPILQKFKKEQNKENVEQTIEQLNYIQENTKKIYDDLMDLEKGKKKLLIEQGETNNININEHELLQKKENTTKGQQTNMYALNVWRRVKMKLEGRDPDSSRKFTAQEQVDYVIKEATSLDNLALLYEGWTPWV